MTIQVTWENDAQTALLIQFDHEWDWNDYHTAVVTIANLAHQVEHNVDLIFDLQASHPIGSEALIHIRRWLNLWPANIGHVAIITHQLMVTAVISILGRTLPNCRGNISLVHTPEEARRILAERRGR